MTFKTLPSYFNMPALPNYLGQIIKEIDMTTSTHGKALVTGASTGIGAIYAERLAKRGYDLILVARNRERLNTLAHKITSETVRSVQVLSADLTKKDDMKKVEEVLKNDPSISMLVNNAGIGSVAGTLESDVETMDDMIQLNITALTRLTYAIAPVFVNKGKGTIINISSVVGIAVEMLNGVYSASKSYVLSFGHRLQKDLADKGVRIQTVLPGATATEFWDIAGYSEQKTRPNTMSAEDLVDAALAGLDLGETVTIPGLQDQSDWNNWDAARKEMADKFRHPNPAPRYGVGKNAAVN